METRSRKISIGTWELVRKALSNVTCCESRGRSWLSDFELGNDFSPKTVRAWRMALSNTTSSPFAYRFIIHLAAAKDDETNCSRTRETGKTSCGRIQCCKQAKVGSREAHYCCHSFRECKVRLLISLFVSTFVTRRMSVTSDKLLCVQIKLKDCAPASRPRSTRREESHSTSYVPSEGKSSRSGKGER